MALIKISTKGLYCPKGKFYIDPWKPVNKALITHAHADHARSGMKSYLAHPHTNAVMRHRLGADIKAQDISYGEELAINGVQVSFHPAGHVPGSAQIRVSDENEAWVISGDYKLGDDGLSDPYEPVKCDHFITESTFGLPVYRWKDAQEIYSEINNWWVRNAEAGLCSVLLGYSFGKAQRLHKHLNPEIGEIFMHGAIANTNEVLESIGYSFPKATYVTPEIDKKRYRGSLVLAPPSAMGSSWIRQFKPYKIATASGWMALRGAKRRRNVDKGFVLSDHADWAQLNEAVQLSGAENVYVTHGYSSVFSKWLRDQGLNASILKTEFEGELAEIVESQNKEES